MVHRLAQIATGLFAVHEFDLDSGEKAAGSFYKMLKVKQGSAEAQKERESFIPHSPTLSFYCHPDRILDDVASVKQSLGDLVPSAYAAVDRIREVMEEPAPTPAWLAVTQRYIENAAADWAPAKSETGGDLAAREGVWEALEFALRAIAENSGSPQGPAKEPEPRKGGDE
jgi:hypothetical protein